MSVQFLHFPLRICSVENCSFVLVWFCSRPDGNDRFILRCRKPQNGPTDTFSLCSVAVEVHLSITPRILYAAFSSEPRLQSHKLHLAFFLRRGDEESSTGQE